MGKNNHILLIIVGVNMHYEDFKVDDHILKTLTNYAISHKYDLNQLVNEILQISIKKNNFDILDFNPSSDNNQNKRVTNSEMEESIHNFFTVNFWNRKIEETTILGLVYENYIGKNKFYYSSNNLGKPFIIVSDEKTDIFSKVTNSFHYETNQIFSWIGPYTRKVKHIVYEKENKTVDLIIA